jgi:hypothetical protein
LQVTGKVLGLLTVLAWLPVLGGCGQGTAPDSSIPGAEAPAAATSGSQVERTLELVRAWVHGHYDNAGQAEADLADDSIPDDHKHRLVHQLFVPVEVAIPGIPGYLVFQQASSDGSYDPETINRAGLIQYLPDPEAGVVRQRELNFVDVPAWRNAHLEPERFRTLTLADVRFDPGCDFLLAANAEGTAIEGPMPRGTCRFFSPGLNRELIADDAVTILPDGYWFLGRFVDESGAVMWGNASQEPFRLVRRPQRP